MVMILEALEAIEQLPMLETVIDIHDLRYVKINYNCEHNG